MNIARTAFFLKKIFYCWWSPCERRPELNACFWTRTKSNLIFLEIYKCRFIYYFEMKNDRKCYHFLRIMQSWNGQLCGQSHASTLVCRMGDRTSSSIPFPIRSTTGSPSRRRCWGRRICSLRFNKIRLKNENFDFLLEKIFKQGKSGIIMTRPCWFQYPWKYKNQYQNAS